MGCRRIKMTCCKVGIVDFSVYLPEQTITAEEFSKEVDVPVDVLKEKMGIHRKFVGGPEDHPGIMAVKASKDVLQKTGIEAEEIDLIIYTGETYAEYTCWTVGIYIQQQIGATAESCYAFDLSFRCAGSPLGLKVAQEMMMADPKLKTVLVAGGNANAYLINHKDPRQSFMYNMSPSAFATILKRDLDENQIVGTGILTDPVFATDVVCTHGGSRNQMTLEMAKDIVENPELLDEINKITLTDPERMKEDLAQRSLPDFTGVVGRACKVNSYKTSEIDYLSMVATSPRSQFSIMDELGIARDKTDYLYDYGHCGHSDNWIGLDLGLKSGKIKDGSLVCLLGAGTGYAFSSALIRWGKNK
ncbi:MAG: 3-oxoacyl-ACP synthase [Gammaproteobacteria bacterium]|nr:MAG: 3-oxoacyl-ACP synthase [Gammaproteobacteria bacterium]